MGSSAKLPLVDIGEEEEALVFEDEEKTELIRVQYFRRVWEHRFSPRYAFDDSSKPTFISSSLFQLLAVASPRQLGIIISANLSIYPV